MVKEWDKRRACKGKTCVDDILAVGGEDNEGLMIGMMPSAYDVRGEDAGFEEDANYEHHGAEGIEDVLGD